MFYYIFLTRLKFFNVFKVENTVKLNNFSIIVNNNQN